ncbi:hypothetical protein HN51_032006 [Arachis hypogaea]|nr:U3 small nucleolar ribonucleoprotein [Arachis hypogaea]
MKAQLHQESEGSDEEDDDMEFKKQNKGSASTHQKQLEKIQSKMEQMEKANLEPKAWNMQGEVTAAKRPKNSALEVDLDFKHNVRPAPVITEEVTASIEDMIKKRITEGNFNDVQRAPKLPSKVPRITIKARRVLQKFMSKSMLRRRTPLLHHCHSEMNRSNRWKSQLLYIIFCFHYLVIFFFFLNSDLFY